MFLFSNHIDSNAEEVIDDIVLAEVIYKHQEHLRGFMFY